MIRTFDLCGGFLTVRVRVTRNELDVLSIRIGEHKLPRNSYGQWDIGNWVASTVDKLLEEEEKR